MFVFVLLLLSIYIRHKYVCITLRQGIPLRQLLSPSAAPRHRSPSIGTVVAHCRKSVNAFFCAGSVFFYVFWMKYDEVVRCPSTIVVDKWWPALDDMVRSYKWLYIYIYIWSCNYISGCFLIVYCIKSIWYVDHVSFSLYMTIWLCLIVGAFSFPGRKILGSVCGSGWARYGNRLLWWQFSAAFWLMIKTIKHLSHLSLDLDVGGQEVDDISLDTSGIL